VHIYVFHYHLLPCGVTDVIVRSVEAVAAHRDDVDAVTLVCGREENTANVLRRLEHLPVPVDVSIVPEIDYTPARESTDEAASRSRKLQAVLLSRFTGKDVLWWTHNYHVGKNPALTLALCNIAEMADHPRMVFHIHDFPECARYENLSYLTRVAGESPYPASRGVAYAVINARDLSYMQRAGIPEDRVHLVVNPLPPAGSEIRTGLSRANLARALTQYASVTHQRCDPDRPILLYPIRAIRRKNVLEMGLIARLAGDWNLVTTLPGLSDSESAYSRLVSSAYLSGSIRGVFGIGRREGDFGTTFDELATQSDVTVSSSVQEGFGMLFIDSLRWRRPLFARDLNILDGVRDVFQSYPARFYTEVRVPFTSDMTANSIREQYNRRLARVETIMPDPVRSRLHDQLDSLLGSEAVDFGYLAPRAQMAVLTGIRDEGFAREVRSLNESTVASLLSVARADCPHVADRVDSQFGYAAFARAVDSLIQSFDGGQREPGRFEIVQQRLIEQFADMDLFRLVLAPMEEAV
jgi:hypothetical protein